MARDLHPMTFSISMTTGIMRKFEIKNATIHVLAVGGNVAGQRESTNG